MPVHCVCVRVCMYMCASCLGRVCCARLVGSTIIIIVYMGSTLAIPFRAHVHTQSDNLSLYSEVYLDSSVPANIGDERGRIKRLGIS